MNTVIVVPVLIINDQGKVYYGVGDVDGVRSNQSLKKLQTDNPDRTFEVANEDIHPNKAEAYKAEDNAIFQSGGVESDNNYNINNSPGKKLNDLEDGE